MREYETIVLLKPDLGDVPLNDVAQKIKAVVDNAHEDGLEHAAFGNRGRKFVDCPLIEMLARLQRIRPNSANFYRSHAARGGPVFCPDRANRLVNECAQSAPKAGGFLHAASSANCGRRAMISRASLI